MTAPGRALKVRIFCGFGLAVATGAPRAGSPSYTVEVLLEAAIARQCLRHVVRQGHLPDGSFEPPTDVR